MTALLSSALVAGRLVMRTDGVLALVRTSDGRTLWTSTRGRV